MIFLDRPYNFKIFKGCLPQILLGPFLNALLLIILSLPVVLLPLLPLLLLLFDHFAHAVLQVVWETWKGGKDLKIREVTENVLEK